MNAAMRRLLHGRATVAFAFLIGVWCVFGVINSRYLTLGNAASIALQMSVLVLLSTGQMFALMVRGFDISVGAVAALSSVVAALAWNQFGPIGLLAGVLTGLAAGTINGFLIARVEVQPIIATLGMLIGARGMSLLASDSGQVIPIVEPQAMLQLAYGKWFGMAPLAWLAIGSVVLAAGLIRFTLLGRRMLMLGSNPDAARLVGMNATGVHIAAYQMTGIFASLAGLAMLARAGSGLPTDGAGLELQSIASAVIGGTALAGGVASPLGTLVGSAFIQSLGSGLNMSGISPFTAEIAIGAVIIAASCVSVAPQLVSRLKNRVHKIGESRR
ncbi:L-arabinose transport system permease protein [Aquamicrobium terrae]